MGRQKGFTIVELLIVIVVIGILAAITIVGFNGVQNKARSSAAQSAASQANKKILAFATENSDTYPNAAGSSGIDNLATLGITNNNNTTYQYASNNTSNPRTYCLTATNVDQSFYVSNTISTPTKGACRGQSDGGVAVITNLAINPSVEANTNSWTAVFSTTGSNGVQDTSKSYSGNASYKVSRTAAFSDARMARYTIANHPTGSFVASAWVWAEPAMGTISVAAELAASSNSAVNSGGVTGQWVRVSIKYTVTTSGNINLNFAGGTNQVAAVYIDGLMIESGTTLHTYADGSSDKWDWNGTVNNSSSTGMPL